MEAQRSGFHWERTSDGMSEPCPLGRGEGYAVREDDVSRETILSIWPRLKEYSPDVYEEVEIEAKYSGYIKRQLADIEVFNKDEKLKIRDDINYAEIGGLSNEMVAKLSRVRPATIGEASRISGVTPAAIMAILGHLKK